MRVIVAALLACTACSSTTTQRSALPPYVRDLRPQAGGVQMIQCEIVYTKVTHRNWDWIRMQSDRDVETNLADGACWTTAISTQVAQ